MQGGSRLARAVFNVRQMQQEARHRPEIVMFHSANVEKKIWRQVVDDLMDELERDTDALCRP